MSSVSTELIPLDAPTLVEASAGTGKTYAITTYFVRAIVERGYMPDQILVVTYTKAATAELRARTRKRVDEALQMLDEKPKEAGPLYEVLESAMGQTSRREVENRLRGALGQMDQAAILTIHGFCQRLLQEHPLAFGTDLEIEVAENIKALHADLARDYWSMAVYDRPEWFLEALDHEKISTGHLEQLANVATMPGVEVIGPDPCPMDPEGIERASAAHRKAGQLWFEHREAVLELLKDDALNRRYYGAKTIENKWIPGLNALFARNTLQPLPADYFSRLAASEMVTKQDRDPPRHAFFDACEELLRSHERIQPGIDYALYAFQREFCEYVRDQSRSRREDAALFSFDDLLTSVHEVVTGNSLVAGNVREQYPLALVDEFQDTDSIQYGIFRAIYGEGSAVYVGDPKQSIYAFRGADVFSYLDAKRNVAGRTHTLSTNRRSDPGVVRATNALFSRQHPPFLIEGISFAPAEAHVAERRTTLLPPLELVFLRSEDITGSVAERVAPIVAKEVAALLDSGARIEERAVEPGDVAVLCRSNNQAIAVTKALRDLDVPTSLDGDASVFNTTIASDLLAVLDAALLPGDTRSIRRALLSALIGVSPYELASMTDNAWSDWVAQFRTWNDIWHRHGVLRFLQATLDATNAEAVLAARASARRDLTDLLHLQELLLRGEGDRNRDPVSLMQWFRRLADGHSEEGMVAAEDLQQRPDAESGAVRVTTIHKSKGLEYGVVFCPFTWGGAKLFPFESRAVKFHAADGSLRVDLGSAGRDGHLEQAKLEAKSEALRLLYVAITRAKHQCILFWGKRPRETAQSALAYLLHDRDALSGLSEEQMRTDVQTVVAELGADARCREPLPDHGARERKPGPTRALAARAATRRFDRSANISSFTSLTGHDEKAPGPSIADTTSALFPELPGGKRTGLLLHAIFERGEPKDFLTDEGESLIKTQLGLHGFDRSLSARLQRDLSTAASTPLLARPSLPSLAELDPERRLRELEFMLAVERPNLGQLSELLKRHSAASSVPDYHTRLERLTQQALEGFLRGFIDLMFEWEGRWYVADYKSNRLPTYTEEAVVEAVQREHYVLQGLLYSAAAHRYLRQRLPHYDPAEHFGGMLFLFLRGMEGPASNGRGVFFDRPSTELLDGLDSWLGGSDEPT